MYQIIYLFFLTKHLILFTLFILKEKKINHNRIDFFSKIKINFTLFTLPLDDNMGIQYMMQIY